MSRVVIHSHSLTLGHAKLNTALRRAKLSCFLSLIAFCFDWLDSSLYELLSLCQQMLAHMHAFWHRQLRLTIDRILPIIVNDLLPLLLTGWSLACKPLTADAGTTIARTAEALVTRWYSGCLFPPRMITSCVMIAAALDILRREAISAGANESAMPTTAQPARTIPR